MPPDTRPTAPAESYLGLLGVVLALALGAGLVYAMARTWTGWHTVLALLLVGLVAGIYAWRGQSPQQAAGLLPPLLLNQPQTGDSLQFQRYVAALNGLDQMRSRQQRDGLTPPAPRTLQTLPDPWEIGPVDTFNPSGFKVDS